MFGTLNLSYKTWIRIEAANMATDDAARVWPFACLRQSTNLRLSGDQNVYFAKSFAANSYT